MPDKRDDAAPVKKEVPKLPSDESESLLDFDEEADEGDGKLDGCDNQDLSKFNLKSDIEKNIKSHRAELGVKNENYYSIFIFRDNT